MSLISKSRTVLKYCRSSWWNSAFIRGKCGEHSRLFYYFDLICCYLRYGDDFNDYCTFEFWNKSAKERDSYISVRRNDILRFAMSDAESYDLFLDKAKFNKRFDRYVKRGWMETSSRSASELKEFCTQYDSVILKPLSDFGGHGVIKMSVCDTTRPEELEAFTKGKYIAEEQIHNCEKLQRLAPNSLNTLRFVTVIDNSGKLHVVASLLRMGNGTSVTDNYHDGGMACAIDIKTGKLSGAAYGMNNVSYVQHPFSKIVFDGFEIPGFFECLEAINEIAFMEPTARYVGWDVAITTDGIELLEGNIPPGEDITQIATGCGIWYELLKWK